MKGMFKFIRNWLEFERASYCISKIVKEPVRGDLNFQGAVDIKNAIFPDSEWFVDGLKIPEATLDKMGSMCIFLNDDYRPSDPFENIPLTGVH